MSQPAGIDRTAVERALADLIAALRLDSRAEPELSRTPERMADLFTEVFKGVHGEAPEIATFPFEGRSGDAVIVRDLVFHSLCVHHFVPFFGRAHVAYLPGERIMGISGAARIVDHYARRPQLQERMTHQIAEHLEGLLAPRGVAVVLEARHLCMEMRGVRRYGRVETRALRGAMAEAPWTESLALGRSRPQRSC
jgi:GTP cyclohydrolase I